jgi:hypothetical protein
MARAKPGMGAGNVQEHQGEARTERAITDESELGSDLQGNDQLRGDDQRNQQNERQTVPEEKPR